MNRSIQTVAVALSELSQSGPGLALSQLERCLPVKRTSVFNLLKQLEDGGLISRGAETVTTRGRPGQVWRLDGDAGRFLVIYWSHHHTYLALYDFAGELVELTRHPAATSLDKARAQVRDWLRGRSLGAPLLGAQIAFAGIVNSATGHVVLSPKWNLQQFPLASVVAEDLAFCSPVMVRVENDAHVAALAEYVNGCCLDVGKYLTLFFSAGSHPENASLGIGSGMIWDGEIVKGMRGAMGELDAMFYAWFHENCPAEQRPASLQDLTRAQLSAWAADLGQNMSHIVNYLAPQAVVMQFGEGEVDTHFFQVFKDGLQLSLLAGVAVGCEVRLSQLGERAVLDGAASALRRAFLQDTRAVACLMKR